MLYDCHPLTQLGASKSGTGRGVEIAGAFAGPIRKSHGFRCSKHINIMHWRIPCFYNILPCYHSATVFECLCLARTISVSQTFFWAPKMRPSLVPKATSLLEKDTAHSNFGATILGPRIHCCILFLSFSFPSTHSYVLAGPRKRFRNTKNEASRTIPPNRTGIWKRLNTRQQLHPDLSDS